MYLSIAVDRGRAREPVGRRMGLEGVGRKRRRAGDGFIPALRTGTEMRRFEEIPRGREKLRATSRRHAALIPYRDAGLRRSNAENAAAAAALTAVREGDRGPLGGVFARIPVELARCMGEGKARVVPRADGEVAEAEDASRRSARTWACGGVRGGGHDASGGLRDARET